MKCIVLVPTAMVVIEQRWQHNKSFFTIIGLLHLEFKDRDPKMIISNNSLNHDSFTFYIQGMQSKNQIKYIV